ncbi:hypothetical protein [Vagococcus fluvialis]|uniref:hypothetical protein n=1 Tax=Vagococcus fluvialis TaxID=2738 RepID=UPI00378C813B
MRKNLGKIVVLLSLIFILASCGSHPKDEFIGFFEKHSNQKEKAYDFTLKIEDLEAVSATGNEIDPTVGMIITQLKDISIDGTVRSQTKKQKALSVDMMINSFGMNIPFTMIGSFDKEPKLYFGTDILDYFTSVVNSMTDEELNEVDYSQLDGKYIELFSLTNSVDSETWETMLENIKAEEKNQEIYKQELIEYMRKLDKKSFTKKDNLISHTFSSKELIDLLKLQEDSTEIIKLLKKLDEIEAKVTVNPKNNDYNLVIYVKPSGADAENIGFSTISLMLSFKLNEKRATINVPKEEDVLSQEELEEILPGLTTVDWQEEPLTDEEFIELQKEIEEIKDLIDEPSKEELLETYKMILTDKQYEEMKRLLTE